MVPIIITIFSKNNGLKYFAYIIFFICSVVFMLKMGRVEISFNEMYNAMIGSKDADTVFSYILYEVRLPRVLGAIYVGFTLSVVGLVMQAIFKNPIVDAQMLGISSGGALGGVIAMSIGLGTLGFLTMAFIGGLSAIFFVFYINRKRFSILYIILTGIIISGFISAIISLMLYFINVDKKLPTIMHWLMGSLVYIDMQKLTISLVIGLPLLFVLYLLRWHLNTFATMNEDAYVRRVFAHRIRNIILVICTILLSSTIALAGVVAWVGLITPHIIRMFYGGDNYSIFFKTGILGAFIVMFTDTLVRSATIYELPLGVVTTIVGAPIFLYIVQKIVKE